jgi:hypothetical protein
MKAKHGSRIGQIFADGRRIDEALRLAARDAIRKHALHGAPVVIWRDGRTAWVPAQELGAKAQRKTSRKGTRSPKRGR